MKYDVVIATLNRVKALELSLPLLAAQTLPASNVIIVDATDDHDAMKRQVQEIADKCSLEVKILRSTRKNSAHQRNLGLELVTAPIVLMPDDDSLLYPNSAELMVNLYAEDTEERIGAVTAQPVESSPLLARDTGYKRTWFSRLKGRIQKYRNIYEHRCFPLPTCVYARSLMGAGAVPMCIDGTNHRLVESIGGYRMSFRTEILKRIGGFYDVLGYGIGYAIHEDTDAIMRVMNEGYLLATAQRAMIFHNVFPSRRAGGFNYGFFHFANTLLIVRRIIPANHAAWRSVSPYFLYKLLLYRSNCFNSYGRSVYNGAYTAWCHREQLLAAAPEDLESAYCRMCDRFIER